MPLWKAAVRGETAKMSAIKRLSDQPYRIETEMVDVTQVANFEKKKVTADGPSTPILSVTAPDPPRTAFI